MSVGLEFALVGNVARFAREFVGVPVADRPAARCPCSNEPVVWKAGDVKVPHVAHARDSACAASRPETAAHMNAKARVAHILGGGKRLWIRLRCQCGTTIRAIWSVPAWCRAEVEYRIGSRRPDVVLFNEAGAIVAAIEVLHSHAVDAEKASDLAFYRTRWIETRASEVNRWARGLTSANENARSLHVWNGDAASLAVRCRRCA